MTTTTTTPAPGDVTTLLQDDHARLDAIFEDARAAAKGGALDAARARFAEARAGLDRHIEAEEQVLFPAFEDATGMRGGPTSVMRSEHVELRRLLGTIDAALERADGAAADAAFEGLERLLGAHNHKEEQVLYPMIDRSMGPRLASLVGAIRAAIAPAA